MIGTLDSQVIKKFKEFQKITGKYSDLDIENVEFEKISLDNETFFELNPKKSEIDVSLMNANIEVSFVPLKKIDEKKGIMDSSESKKILDVYKSYTYFKENDVIFTKVTPSMENGNFAIAENLINGIGFGSSEYFVFRCKNFLPKLLWLLFRTNYFKNKAKKTMHGTGGLKRVPIEFFRNEHIPIPRDYNKEYKSIDIQRAMVELLEYSFDNLEKIKNIIDKKHEIVTKIKHTLIPATFKKTDIKNTFKKYANENNINFDITDIEFDEINYEFGSFFDFVGGNSQYKKEYISNNKGDYYLYTGSTGSVGSVKPIKQNDIIEIPAISYNKDNDKGSRAFYHTKPFVVGGHHYVLKLKKGSLNKINLKYAYYLLSEHFQKNAYFQSKEPRANINIIKQVKFLLPKQLKDNDSSNIQKVLSAFIEEINNELNYKYVNKFEKSYEIINKIKETFLRRMFFK